MEKKSSLVDVPVKINIWTRPEFQRKQFEVIKAARPSIIFLQSDGGRNKSEWDAIKINRAIFENEVDWECEIYKLYEEENNGLYAMIRKVTSFIWERVDRCIFLEDDHIPSVSFFQYCAELLEKYKDDQRIGMITGNNVFGTYPDAEPNDYFFSETGWSIWGIATWRDREMNNDFPLKYRDDKYIISCMRNDLSAFWFNKVKGYSKGVLVDGHIPGSEYYFAVNNVLYHRLSIIPTKNMICNIGVEGTHAHKNKSKKEASFFNLPTYEIELPIKHPDYIIDDKQFGRRYSRKNGHSQSNVSLFFNYVKHAVKLLFSGKLIAALKRKINNSESEK